LFAGPPGVGKTHLAELIAKEQTPPSQKEAATLALIHGESSPPARPTRKPHHSATLQSLTGGARLNIGELGLAHAGILLLDELAEFPAPTLDALREPMDDGMVRLSRAQGQLNYPARFQLIATMNPCPCGYFFSSVRSCRCQPSKVRSYLGKARGPLLDRFHMLVWLDPNDPNYARANNLCAALIDGNELTTMEQPPTLAPNGVSNRSAERTKQLLECLEDHFPASPAKMREAAAWHLRHLGTMVREIDGLI
jgi:predicted ATPase with chaperone activity